MVKTKATLRFIYTKMSLRFATRQLSNSSVRWVRSKNLKFTDLKNIKLREPIVPSHKNFDVSPDHPLWAFFPDGNKSETSFRTASELEGESNAWTMPMLRRKSFEDLHKLWYLTLKERNVLAREVRLAESINERNTQRHDDIDAKLVLTQKRIKQVLLERQVAYERARTMVDEKAEFLAEFERRYVEAPESEIVSFNEKLVRLQYALFGIQPQLEDYNLEEDINEDFVEGLSFVAKVKLNRYLNLNHHAASSFETPLNGPMEELPFLLHSSEEAIEKVQKLRDAGQSVALDNIEVFPFLRSALGQEIEGLETEA